MALWPSPRRNFATAPPLSGRSGTDEANPSDNPGPSKRAPCSVTVVVCRARGTTVAELAVIGVPAILVPLPIAPRDHQRANAAVLLAAGAAVLVDDAECRTDRLARELGPILEDDNLRARMTAAAA